MTGGLCTYCHEYPEGSACTASGCPGRPFKKTPAPRSPGSDNASGTHHGHAAEVTSDGGTTGFITRRESMAMASGGRASACPPQIYDSGREVDLTAWLLTVPGIPADWPTRQPIEGNGLALASVSSAVMAGGLV